MKNLETIILQNKDVLMLLRTTKRHASQNVLKMRISLNNGLILAMSTPFSEKPVSQCKIASNVDLDCIMSRGFEGTKNS